METVKVENTTATLLIVADLRLVPGVNAVKRASFDNLTKGETDGKAKGRGERVTFRQWMHLGLLRVVEPGAKVGASAPKHLNDRPADAAIALVSAESDQKVLVSWAKADRRGDVKSAIDARLTEIAQERLKEVDA